MKYIDKALLFLKTPGTGFKKEEKTTFIEAFKYALFFTIITALGESTLVTISLYPNGPVFDMLFLFMIILPFYYAVNVIALIIGGLWFHLWAFILGAKKDIKQTFKSLFYGETPVYLLGWVPFVGLIMFIWSMILTGMGMIRLQKMREERAGLAIIIAVLLPLIVMALVVMLFNINMEDFILFFR